MSDLVTDLLDYVDRSPTPYHAVAETARRLAASGFQELSEKQTWDLSPGDRADYRRLRQAKWDAALLATGHLGGHMGWSSTAFAREFIAPVLRGEEPPPIFKPVTGNADDTPQRSGAELAGKGGEL